MLNFVFMRSAFCRGVLLFTSADAGVRKFWLVNQTIEQACSANQTGDLRLRHVVKHFPLDDFSVRIQNHYVKLSVWLSRNIFYLILLTIIRQNIGILSSECKWGVCVNVSINFRFCVRRIAHCRAFWKQGLSGIILSRTFFFQLFTVRFETFLSYVASFWCDSGGKLSFASIFHSLAK